MSRYGIPLRSILLLCFCCSFLFSTSFFLHAASAVPCYIQIDTSQTSGSGGATFLSTNTFQLFSPDIIPLSPDALLSSMFLKSPVFWTSGFRASFDVNLTLPVSPNGMAPPGLAFLLVARTSSLTPVPQPGSLGSSLGYSGIASSIALEIDLQQDSTMNDPIGPSISVHTGYAAANSADISASVPLVIPNIPVTFSPGSQILSITIEYFPSTHRIEYCLNIFTSPQCATAQLDQAQFDLTWNSEAGDNKSGAFIGFTASSTNQQYGGISINNFKLSAVQMAPALSSMRGLLNPGSSSGNQANFLVSNSLSAAIPQGTIVTVDACNNPLFTSSAPSFRVTTLDLSTGSTLVFMSSIKNLYNGSYNFSFAWSMVGSYNISISVNQIPMKGSPFRVNLIAGPFDLVKSLLGITPPIEKTIILSQTYVHTITWLDEFGNQVVPTMLKGVIGWNDATTTTSIDLSGTIFHSFSIFSDVDRTTLASRQYTINLTRIGTGTVSQTWNISTIQQQTQIFTPSYGAPPFTSITANSTTPLYQLDVTLLALDGSKQTIPTDYIRSRVIFVGTDHPHMAASILPGTIMSENILPASMTGQVNKLPYFTSGTFSVGATLAGRFNMTIFLGSFLTPAAVFPFTVVPDIPFSYQVPSILPSGYASSNIDSTTSTSFYFQDQYSNWIYTSYPNMLVMHFFFGVNIQETLCDGGLRGSATLKVRCSYNNTFGKYDVNLGSTTALIGATVQPRYSNTNLDVTKAPKVDFLAGICVGCTNYTNVPVNVTFGSVLTVQMNLFDLSVPSQKDFISNLTSLTLIPTTSTDWLGLPPTITRIAQQPTKGMYTINYRVSPTLRYQSPKISSLIPYFDGVAGTKLDVKIIPNPTDLCLANTKYTNVSLSVLQSDSITFDINLYTFSNVSYTTFGAFLPTLKLVPDISSYTSYNFRQDAIPGKYHVIITSNVGKFSTVGVLKITPSINQQDGDMPPLPDITILPPICVSCTKYSVLPSTMKQGENITFLIYLFNATSGNPVITSLPSDLTFSVDLNPALFSTPTLTKAGLNLQVSTRFVVDDTLPDINVVFRVKLYQIYAPNTPQIALKHTASSPVVCVACTTYKAADGMSALPTTVPSGGVLTFTLFLLDSSSNLLGLLLPTSNITFDLSSGVTQYHVSSNPGVDDTKYSVTITFYEIGPIDQPRLLTVWPILNGENAPSINITLLPPVYCASCTRYAQQSTTIIPAGEQFKLSILLYTQNGLTLGSYLPIENVTVIGTEIVKVNVVVRDDIPILQSAPAPAPNKLVVTSAAAAAAAAGGVVVKASTTTTTTTTGTASGYEISITFNIPITTTAITTSISVALNGVSINRPITLTLRPPVPPTDQPDPCLDIDPRLTCPDQSRQCISTIILLPERNGGKNYTYECRDILKIQKIIPTTTWSNVSTLITITMTYDLPTNLHLILNGHDIFSLTPSATNSRMFTFMMPPAVELNYTIAHNQTNGLRVNFSLSAHIGAYDYLLNDIPSPGLTLLPTPCVSVGTYWIPSTDACLPCPSHAYCPGGTDIYPLPGYYSTSNNDPTITKCLVANACNGFSSDQAGEIEFSVTDQCNMNAGYTGILCSDCTSDHYKQELVCRSCGLDDAAQKQLILVLIVALVVFGVMSFGVAFIKDEKLAIYITIIVFIQQCSFVGSIGSSKLSSGGLAAFFQFLSLLNFEVAYFKLGCTVPQITYVKVFWATILMMIVAALMLTIASGLFAYTRSEEYLRLKGAERSKVFSRRMQNSMTILGVVVYLQLTTQFFKGLFCVEINDQHVLQVEPSTVCYEGGHLITAIFIWPLLFAYSCGFPILCFWLVMRTRSLNLWSSSAAKFVYLYRGLKIRFIYFKQFNFVTSFALALQITLSTTSNVTVRLATAFLFFSLNVFLVGVFWPYYKKFQNWLAIVAGLANALSGLAILTVLSSQVGQDSSKLGDLEGIGLFFLGFSILTFFVLLIFPARYLSKKYLPGIESTEDDELLQSGHYDQLAASRTSKGLGTNPLNAKRQAKTIKTLDAAAAAAADSSAIELQEHQLVQQRADDSSPFDNEPQKPIVKHLDIDTEKNEEYINGPTSPSAASNNNNNNNNKYAAPPPPDHHHHHHHPSLPPSSSSSASASPPPLPLPSPSASPGLPIHDHSDYTQSDDTTIQSSDVELQPIPSPPQPKFDADEYEREHEEGLL